jgi:predicted RNA binding protein YcfA (HicA-like mRNA interferase family)
MRIPSLSSDDVVRVLKKAGFVKDLPAGTLHAIMDQAGLSRDEFLRLLSDT